MSEHFTLERHQVPEPPHESALWPDWLRWLVVVMNPDDPQLHFAASLLSHALKTGSLSQKQAAAGNRMLNRVFASFQEGDLLCLKTDCAGGDVVSFTPHIVVDNTQEDSR
ncbi:hypothetical protein PAF17_15950 [Paracoccus sp. Z330]|uniref:Transcriptional regulator n=1 Tax=Paracoccus onchidii TaxID=3017813 RepID=A0ABT4ZI21_9RHOB|nr:hypothetical protein [Paracoccus onchidii]MDB6178985.1 hypothetical protein [Paracoccus onchidii]